MHRHVAAAVSRRQGRQAVVVVQNVRLPITAAELARALELDMGRLTRLRFRATLTLDPNGVEWEAVHINTNVISGRLVLHAAVAEDEVVSWAEVIIEHRVDPVAQRVAVRYQRRQSEGLVPVPGDEDGDLRALYDAKHGVDEMAEDRGEDHVVRRRTRS